jgi:hypothetical protein
MLRPAMTHPGLPLPTRLWLTFVAPFRILFDAEYAAAVAAIGRSEPSPELPSAPPVARTPAAPMAPPATARAETAAVNTEAGALQLLSLLQREGRFVDFVEQEVTKFSDQDVGAAARLVHEGCRRALHAHARISSVRNESEGSSLTLERPSAEVKLVGSVAGSAPFRGVLRHRGWRVESLELPKLVGDHDPHVVAQAELELS